MTDAVDRTDTGAVLPAAHTHDVAANPRESVLKRLVSPRARGRHFRQISRSGAILTVVIGFFFVAALGYGLQLYSELRRPAAVGAGGNGFTYRSVSEVLSDWNSRWFSPGGRSALVGLVAGLIVSSVITWTYLPLVYRRGRVGPPLRQSFLCVAAGMPLAVLGITAIAVFDSPSIRSAVRAALKVQDSDMPTMLVVPIVCATLAFWLTRVFRGLVSDSAPSDALVCEGCSYNLAHRESEERCPECGMSVGDSTLGRVRVGVPYESGGGTWLATIAGVLLQPAAFYRRLRVHGSTAAADRFVRVNLLSLFVVAFFFFGLAAQLMTLIHGNGPTDLGWFLVCGALCATLVCWAGWRVFSALVASVWLILRSVPDFAHVRKVLAYETAYLWVFCAVWAMLLVSFILFDDWVTKLGVPRLNVVPLRGVPPEPLLVLGVTGVLSAVWWWRMERAMRQVRWANF